MAGAVVSALNSGRASSTCGGLCWCGVLGGSIRPHIYLYIIPTYLCRLLIRARIGGIRSRQRFNDAHKRISHQQWGIGGCGVGACGLELGVEGGDEPRGDDFELRVRLLGCFGGCRVGRVRNIKYIHKYIEDDRHISLYAYYVHACHHRNPTSTTYDVPS